MKIRKIEDLKDFLAVVDNCTSDVYLRSINGDNYNLKSELSKYVAIGALLQDRYEMLELFCSNREDEELFFKFFYEHPGVN